ncbi:MAG: pyridoxamine 5'-phosphate oxidase [Bdellovibrionaceae bacterium]|nr:pyridoxamine 5'-phosphate oxidase [Pseudobdellovibrionaceae bacterium]
MSGFNFSLDPIENFVILLNEAVEHKMPDPNAMALATVNIENKPSVRIVFYKGMIRDGFSFYTNYNGRKAQDIAHNNNVCVNFFWSQLERQVRIEGKALKTTRAESEAYFKTRVRESQLGAWASEQSQPLESFETIEKRYQELNTKYANQEIPCPPHWGGYIIVPEMIEFWFGRTGRMHQRYRYQRNGTSWAKSFVNP